MFIALIVVVFVLLLVFLISDARKPQGYPPGPSWLPLIGCFLPFCSLKSQLEYYHLVWAELSRRYGPIVGLRLGKDRIVVISGYETVKHVLMRDDCDGRPDGFFFRMRTFHRRLGVVFTDGANWQEQRRFSTRHLRNLGLAGDAMEKIISEEVEALVESIHRKFNETEKISLPLDSLFNVSVLNSLWAVVAGQRFDLEDDRLLRLFKLQYESFRKLDMSGGPVNQLPILRFIAPERSGYNTLMETVNSNYVFLRETLAEHRNTFTPGANRDLIDAFLSEMEIRKHVKDSSFSEPQLLALCMDLFMAGSETTSNTLSFIMMVMLCYPEVQKRVHDELDHVIGRHRRPCLADRPKLVYLEAVIMEVQRLMNVAPVAVPHRAMRDCDILGHRVPKDTILLLSLWSIHMDPQHWGDPENFRPERFLDQTGTNVVKDEWFMPFGIGKRRCLGEALAKNGLFLFLSTLLQNFNFDLDEGQDAPTMKPLDGVTLTPKPFTGIVTLRM